MKTPIRELIEKYQQMRENGDNDMRTVIYFAESMLEKEEVWYNKNFNTEKK